MKGNSLKKNNRNPLRMDIPFYILLLPALLVDLLF